MGSIYLYTHFMERIMNPNKSAGITNLIKADKLLLNSFVEFDNIFTLTQNAEICQTFIQLVDVSKLHFDNAFWFNKRSGNKMLFRAADEFYFLMKNFLYR